jgi:hypothetical protein
MTKTVSSDELMSQLDSLFGDVRKEGEEAIVEHCGEPKAGITSMAAYEEVQALREEKRRADTLAQFQELHEDIAARNHDLSEEEAIELADRISHELIDRMAERGEIMF